MANFRSGTLGVRALSARAERWPLAAAFVISRGTKLEAEVVVAEISDGPHRGRGEGTPYARYGETTAGVLDQIEGMRSWLESGADRERLHALLPPGAARNAL